MISSREAQCSFTTILFDTKGRIPNFRHTEVYNFETNKLSLKALATSICEDALYKREVQEGLKDNPFVENIKKRYCTNEIN
jgi:hypothetical protein